MPHRTSCFSVVLPGLLGLAILAALVVLRSDVFRAAVSGPRWQRRLVISALLLLAGCGISIYRAATDSGDLATSSTWRHVSLTWRQAKAVADGKRGPHPFSRLGEWWLLHRLAVAAEDLRRLEHDGVLTGPEAGLLQTELAELTRGVDSMRSRGGLQIMCYAPAIADAGRDSAARLTARLPLLDRLARDGILRAEVLSKALDSVERDVGMLARDPLMSMLPAAERATRRRAREAARAQLGRIRERLRPFDTRIPPQPKGA